jgi:hypothetical protein
MPKFLDLECPCGAEVTDMFVMKVPEHVIHMECGKEMEPVYRIRKRPNVQWSDRDAVVVYQKPDGSFSYPGRNDKATPAGCERIVLRSLREVEAHEKKANVRSEMAWFDKGSGRGFDDQYRGERYT